MNAALGSAARTLPRYLIRTGTFSGCAVAGESRVTPHLAPLCSRTFGGEASCQPHGCVPEPGGRAEARRHAGHAQVDVAGRRLGQVVQEALALADADAEVHGARLGDGRRYDLHGVDVASAGCTVERFEVNTT